MRMEPNQRRPNSGSNQFQFVMSCKSEISQYLEWLLVRVGWGRLETNVEKLSYLIVWSGCISLSPQSRSSTAGLFIDVCVKPTVFVSIAHIVSLAVQGNTDDQFVRGTTIRSPQFKSIILK